MRNKKYRKILLIRPISPVIGEAAHPRNIPVPFRLKYIEALLQKDGRYNTRLIDCMIDPLPIAELIKVSLDWCPDAVVVDPTTMEYELTLRYSEAIKKDGDVTIVAIGQDASAEPGRYIFRGSPIDFVLIGESELSLISLLHELNDNQNFEKVRGIHFLEYQDPRLNVVENLDVLPFPIYNNGEFNKYTFFYPVRINKKVTWGHLLSSRGCPYDCIFCSQTIRKSYGKRVRLREPGRVVDEIAYLVEKGANIIAFGDDNFTTSKEHVKAICRQILKRKLDIKWSAHARIDNITDELAQLMKDAGCIQLRFGIESGSNRIIDILRKRNNNNIDWPKKAKEVFIKLKRIGIPTTALFLIGNPTETKTEIEKSMLLAKKLKPDILQACFFTPYPGSHAYELFKERIRPKDILRMYHYQYCAVNLSNLSLEELNLMYSRFYRGYLLRIEYLFRHMFKYGMFYLHNRRTFFKLLNIVERMR